MSRIAFAAAAAAVAALVASASFTSAVAATGRTETLVTGSMIPTAGKKAAKPAKAAKSCGTFMYPDKKTGKCIDARAKK